MIISYLVLSVSHLTTAEPIDLPQFLAVDFIPYRLMKSANNRGIALWLADEVIVMPGIMSNSK